MKAIKIIFSIIISIGLLSYFACSSPSKIDEPDPEIDTPIEVDTVTIEPCEAEMPIYYENNKELFECMGMLRPCDSYNYPIYPGVYPVDTTISQVSKAIASAMTTQALIQAYWEYPYIYVIVMTDQYAWFFDTYMNVLHNNAYHELLTREDACEALFHRLLLVNQTYLAGNARVAPKAFEVLISQPEFLDRYSLAEKKTIIETTLKNDSIRTPLTRVARQTAFFLIGRVLISANYQPFIEEMDNHLLLGSSFYDKWHAHRDTYNDIIANHAKQFLNE